MKNHFKRLIDLKEYVSIIFAAVLLAFVYQLFIVKNGFAPAGLNGIATMVQYKTGFSIGFMSLIINIPLCVFAFFFINKQFASRSLCFCVVYSLVFLYLQHIGLSAFQYNAGGHDTIYPVILSGTLSGLVYGICFKNRASTGGTDIISKYISKKNAALNFFWITFSLNAIVAIASFFVYAKTDASGSIIYDYKPICLCIMYCFISSFVGDRMLKGIKSAVKFTIITKHPAEITDEIINGLHHSATEISAIGSFNRDERTVLICVINKHQITELQNILKKYDNTFSFAETVSDTFGNFVRVK